MVYIRAHRGVLRASCRPQQWVPEDPGAAVYASQLPDSSTKSKAPGKAWGDCTDHQIGLFLPLCILTFLTIKKITKLTKYPCQDASRRDGFSQEAPHGCCALREVGLQRSIAGIVSYSSASGSLSPPYTPFLIACLLVFHTCVFLANSPPCPPFLKSRPVWQGRAKSFVAFKVETWSRKDWKQLSF